MTQFRAFCEKILRRVSRQIFHYTCPVCRMTVLSEKGICPGCLAMLAAEAERTCPHCHRIARECACMLSVPAGYTIGRPARTWLAHTFYDSYEDGVLRTLLHSAKKEYKAALFDYMASTLAGDLIRLRQSEEVSSLPDTETALWQGCTVTWIPRSPSGYDQYGFDQGEECARRIAKYLGIPAMPLFVRSAGRAQKKLDAAARRENAEHSLHLRRDVPLPNGPLFLYDDVITTGSSMTAAVLLLAEAGVTEVFPIAFARTVRGKRPQTPTTEKGIRTENPAAGGA